MKDNNKLPNCHFSFTAQSVSGASVQLDIFVNICSWHLVSLSVDQVAHYVRAPENMYVHRKMFLDVFHKVDVFGHDAGR